MPPIPIYADAPISAAAKADGPTPQTAPPPTRTTDLPATTTSTTNNSYPAAQPGAAAGPAPTGSVSRPPPPPTSTISTSLQHDGPPPPQPGAVPMPFSSSTRSNAYDPTSYQQNPYAAEMTSAQRASLEAAEAAERGRKSGRNSISEWITGEDDGFGSPTTGTAKAWFKGVASQVGDMATKANEFASKKLG
ncbi:unnamed protein product [Aureobasidium uvarum]|uniref:Uncharacterized protein n=1 Tax=Aureobasidium uvarum TaxID=2773716 RepID=A0A9N8PNU4_9PEZI|nr:unnamed protein product [Aureobasidium uvarum]